MIKVFINEPSGGLTDQSARLWYGGQNAFTLIRGQRGTASIVFEIAAADSYQSTVGSPIYVHEITSLSPLVDTIVFAGRIQTIERKWQGNNGDHDDTLTCVSLESCFDVLRIDPPVSYSGMTAGQILTAIFNTYCAGSLSPLVPGVPVTLGNVDLTAGGVLPMQVYRQSERISDVFTSLATLAGTNVIWGVQMSDQTLYLQTTSTTPAPFTLDSYLYETGDWKKDETDYRNRQLVQGSFTAWSTSNEMFPGDNVSRSVRLRVAVDRVTTAMLTVGATQATATGIFGTLSPLVVSNPVAGDYFTITPPHSPPVVEDPYTFVTSLDNTLRNQILIGATAAATCQNTVDAINANPAKAGITFSLPTWENDACNADAPLIGASAPTFVLRVKNPGAGGNGCILTSIHTLSPLVHGALVWQGGSISPLVPTQTTGGTDGTTSALQVSVSGANTLSTDVQYTPGSNLITLASVVPGGTMLSIAYYRLGGDTLAVEDSAAVAIRATAEHGSGKYQQLITDTQNADARSIYIEALQALNNFKVIPESFQFTIFQALLSPGQLLTISISSPTGAPALLDGTWLVQEIQAVIVPGVETLPEPYGHFQYTVMVINTNMIATFVDFWQNLAIVTPAGAQTVNNISTVTSTPSLNAALPTNTAPPAPGTASPNTTGTMAPVPAGQQWIQEALGRYAIYKASNLVVDASVNTRVTAASRSFVSGDIGSIVIVISGAGWTVGEYTITSITGTAANLSGSPAAIGTGGGVWSLVNDALWCTTYNISPSFSGQPVAIISKNASALNPFTASDVGPNNPGGGDYAIQKANQILFASAPTPGSDRLMATYFPAGITPAPVGPASSTFSVTIDVQATDFPQPYTPHVPPGSDRHFFDVAIGGVQEAQAILSVVGTADLAVIWSLISADAVTTDPLKIGALSPSPNGPTKMIYVAPAQLPSTLTPPLSSDVIVLGVQSHADSTQKAFDTITLTGGGPPPSTNFAAIASGSSTGTQIMTSPDAVTWTARSTPLSTTLGGTCIASKGSGIFSAIGLANDNTTWIAATSTDHGVTWTSKTISQPFSSYADLIFANGLFVALRDDIGGGVVVTSPDGATWTDSASLISLGLAGVAFGAGLYVIVTSDSTGQGAQTSPDAMTWTTRTTPAPTSPANQVWQDVCFGGGQFVAVGNFGDPFGGSGFNVMTSPDGITWTSRTIARKQYVGVASGAGLYVACNQTDGTVATSPDGITWTQHVVADAANASRVRFIDSQFVLCVTNGSGQPAILTSPDGLAWTTQSVPLDQLRDVAFG